MTLVLKPSSNLAGLIGDSAAGTFRNSGPFLHIAIEQGSELPPRCMPGGWKKEFSVASSVGSGRRAFEELLDIGQPRRLFGDTLSMPHRFIEKNDVNPMNLGRYH